MQKKNEKSAEEVEIEVSVSYSEIVENAVMMSRYWAEGRAGGVEDFRRWCVNSLDGGMMSFLLSAATAGLVVKLGRNVAVNRSRGVFRMWLMLAPELAPAVRDLLLTYLSVTLFLAWCDFRRAGDAEAAVELPTLTAILDQTLSQLQALASPRPRSRRFPPFP